MSKRFPRQGWRIKRVGQSWRKPRGKQSKLRQHWKTKGAMPNIGYRTAKTQRDKHPSGLYEIRIFTITELQGVNAKTHAVRIAAAVGTKKRIQIAAEAKKLGLRVLNPQRTVKQAAKAPAKEAA